MRLVDCIKKKDSKRVFFFYLKTSYVTIKQALDTRSWKMQYYLKTSYVTIKLKAPSNKELEQINLKTSYVTIKH